MAANWHRFPTGSSNVIFNTPNEWTPNSWIDPCGRWKHGWSENPEWRQNKGTGLEMCTCPEWLQKSKGIPLRVFINKSSTSAKGRTPGPQPKALWSGTRLEFWQLSQRPKQTFWLVVSTHLHTWNVCRCIYIYCSHYSHYSPCPFGSTCHDGKYNTVSTTNQHLNLRVSW